MSSTPNTPARSARNATCPCTVEGIEPCSYACSCASSAMSGGCSRCATYGSLEQRQGHARFIADAVTSSGRNMYTPESIVMSEHHDDREGLDRFKLAQMLQEALFAHPQAGPIPVQASLLTLVMEELRTPRSESAASMDRRMLHDLISHWREFGPEHGFDEKIESFAKGVGI